MKTFLAPLTILILFFITSCYPSLPKYTMYVPNTINSPIKKQKGDYNVSVCFGLVGGIQAQASFAPANHFLIFANGMDNFLLPRTDSVFKHIMNYEAGIGWFYNFNKRNHKYQHLNIIGGFGQGLCWDSFNVYNGLAYGPGSSYFQEYSQKIE